MRKVLAISICILFLFSLSGCWSANELNDFAYVLGLAIDKGKDGGDMLLTAQIAKPAELKPSAEGGGGSGKAYWNIRNEGDTFFYTIRGFSHESAHKLNFQHNNIVIFSREIAEEGVLEYIDFITRDNELRNVWLLVAQNKAADILEAEAEPDLEKIPSERIDKLVGTQEFSSETYTVKALDFIKCLMGKTTSPVAPFIEIIGEGEEQKMLMSGAAVFKKDKLVGELNRGETRGLMWVTDKVKSGIIVVDCPGGEGKVEIEIMEASVTITPEIKDGAVRIKIEIKEKANIASQSCRENLATTEMFKLLESKQASVIRGEITAAIKKARELNADIFGFGEAVKREYPDQWSELEDKWDNVFPNIEIEIMVEAEIYGTGKVSAPVN